MNLHGDHGLLPPAELEWTSDGEAINSCYGDIYCSRAGVFAEKFHVFVAGNGLPARFSAGMTTRVLEFGFGAGLSFFATAHSLLQLTPRSEDGIGPELHFYSIEKHPLSPQDMRRVIAPWPELHPLAEELIVQWPDRVPGFHRRFLAGGRIALTLVFGDVASVLPEIDGRFDAFFLDGFSPRRNAEMWTESVLRHLPRLSAPGARVATYSSARAVVDGLSAVGFSVSRQPGYGVKKHMLTGVLTLPSSVQPKADWGDGSREPVVIIGAGVAGLTVARGLARRGLSVRVFDAAETLGAGGSGNAAGIVSPVMSRDWNLRTALTALGLGFMRADWFALQKAGHGPLGAFSGVIQLARTPAHAARQSEIANVLQLDPGFAEWKSADALSLIGGVPVTMPGWFFPRAGWLAPCDYLQALADHPLIEMNLGCRINDLSSGGASWQGFDRDGHAVFVSDRVVLANAHALESLLPELGQYITPCRGQVSIAARRTEASDHDIAVPLMREGYGVDLPDGRRVFGASFKSGDASLEIRLDEQQENAARLAAISPALCGAALTPVSAWQARVSLRATTPDRLPMVGRIGVELESEGGMGTAPALYVTAGHGSRGFTWCALLAESLVAEMLGEPGPLPASLRAALDPVRFVRRAARRRAGSSV